MKRLEVIERLKRGDTILYGDGFSPNAFFSGDMATVRYDTAYNLIRDGLVDRKKSPTAHGLSYLTWKVASP